MKPLINLKSFLAVLLILILSCSVLVAYFRNYVPGAGNHEHHDTPHRDEDHASSLSGGTTKR